MHLTYLQLNPAHPCVQRDLAHPYELHRTVYGLFGDSTAARPLYRLETPVLILQSATAPRWAHLPVGYLLSHYSAPLRLDFRAGQRLRFRLRANPTRRKLRAGKRVGLSTPAEQIEWIERKGNQHGFVVERATITGCGDSRDTHRSLAWHSVQFDGELTVTHAETFAAALCSGIGSAKGFGFGLLSVWD